MSANPKVLIRLALSMRQQRDPRCPGLTVSELMERTGLTRTAILRAVADMHDVSARPRETRATAPQWVAETVWDLVEDVTTEAH